jgi:NADH:ubiquinone oxidoreductase subunit 6 (subunit J)
MGLFPSIIAVLFGLASIAGAYFILRARDPAHAVMGLLVSVAALGFVYLALGAYLVGLVQIVVYSGATSLVLLRRSIRMPSDRLRVDRVPLTSFFGIVLAAVMLIILLTDVVLMSRAGALGLEIPCESQPNSFFVIPMLVTERAYMLELLAVLLSAAAIAWTHFARHSERQSGPEEVENE